MRANAAGIHFRVVNEPTGQNTMARAGETTYRVGWNQPFEQLETLGYTFVSGEDLEAERDSLKEVVLTKRLAAALKRLNPWLSEDNVQKAVRAVTHVPSTSLIEASEKLYTILTYGISLEQDRGEGKKGQTVRFLDFERPEKNEFLVTRQYRVKGAKRGENHPDPTHSPMLGLLLAEKLKQAGVEHVLVYVDQPNSRLPSANAFLIEYLKK